MSVLVAVPALHVLGSVISVGRPLRSHAAILGLVVDPGLRQKTVTRLAYKKWSILSLSTSVSTRSLSLSYQWQLHDWVISMTVLGLVLTSLSLSETNQEPSGTSSTSGERVNVANH